jgi:hypothetical protein
MGSAPASDMVQPFQQQLAELEQVMRNLASTLEGAFEERMATISKQLQQATEMWAGNLADERVERQDTLGQLHQSLTQHTSSLKDLCPRVRDQFQKQADLLSDLTPCMRRHSDGLTSLQNSVKLHDDAIADISPQLKLVGDGLCTLQKSVAMHDGAITRFSPRMREHTESCLASLRAEIHGELLDLKQNVMLLSRTPIAADLKPDSLERIYGLVYKETGDLGKSFHTTLAEVQAELFQLKQSIADLPKATPAAATFESLEEIRGLVHREAHRLDTIIAEVAQLKQKVMELQKTPVAADLKPESLEKIFALVDKETSSLAKNFQVALEKRMTKEAAFEQSLSDLRHLIEDEHATGFRKTMEQADCRWKQCEAEVKRELASMKEQFESDRCMSEHVEALAATALNATQRELGKQQVALSTLAEFTDSAVKDVKGKCEALTSQRIHQEQEEFASLQQLHREQRDSVSLLQKQVGGLLTQVGKPHDGRQRELCRTLEKSQKQLEALKHTTEKAVVMSQKHEHSQIPRRARSHSPETRVHELESTRVRKPQCTEVQENTAGENFSSHRASAKKHKAELRDLFADVEFLQAGRSVSHSPQPPPQKGLERQLAERFREIRPQCSASACSPSALLPAGARGKSTSPAPRVRFAP